MYYSLGIVSVRNSQCTFQNLNHRCTFASSTKRVEYVVYNITFFSSSHHLTVVQSLIQIGPLELFLLFFSGTQQHGADHVYTTVIVVNIKSMQSIHKSVSVQFWSITSRNLEISEWIGRLGFIFKKTSSFNKDYSCWNFRIVAKAENCVETYFCGKFSVIF